MTETQEKTRVVGVIPTFNHAPWLMGAVHSMAGQDHPPEAIVVVDDGSTDGTWGAFAEGLDHLNATEDFRRQRDGTEPYGHVAFVPVHFIRHETPRGPAAARNAGAALATRLYSPHLFAFLDSDDEYKPGKISASVRAWERAPSAIACVFSDYSTKSSVGETFRQYKSSYSRTELLRECIVNSDSLISREAFEWAGGFAPLRVVEDYALWLKFSHRYICYHLPEDLLTVRVGEHSSSSTVRKEIWEASYREAFRWAGLTK